MNKNLIIGLAGGFVAGAAAGAGVVYALLNKKYAQIMNESLDVISEEMSKDYARFYADWQPKPSEEEVQARIEEDRLETASKLVNAAKAQQQEILEEMDYNGASEEPEDPIVNNVFEEAEKSELQALIEELSEPSNSHPYLITADEYMEPYENYGKLSITWFEEDDILIDESDESIIDSTELIGSDVLRAFGHNPRDKDTIHVRNDKFEGDFEVTRDRRSYAEVIAGVREPEEPRRRKSRREDDE